MEFANRLALVEYGLSALISVLLDRGAAIIDHVALADLVGMPGSGRFVEVDDCIGTSLTKRLPWRKQLNGSAGIGDMVGVIKMAHRT